MTATSRFKTGRPIVPDRDRADCLVAVVGLRGPLGAKARGVLERCELRALELPSPLEACRVLETVIPDAIVVDSHHPELKDPSDAATLLVDVLTAHRYDGLYIPLVVLTSNGLGEAQRLLLCAGAVLLPAHLQTYREIAAIVRRLCGLANTCCPLGRRPNSRLTCS
jgi:hypothetical protein